MASLASAAVGAHAADADDWGRRSSMVLSLESSTEEPLSGYLKRTQAAPANAVTWPTARVTHLQLALGASGWCFVGAYLTD